MTTSRTNRQLVLDVRQALAELDMLSEAPAAGVVALGGSSTKKGHKVLARVDITNDGEWRDAPPASLADVFRRRFADAAGDPTRLEETLVAARVALRAARVRQRRQVIDTPDWKVLFVERAAGQHYVEAAAEWGISGSYARKLRRLAGVRELDGQRA